MPAERAAGVLAVRGRVAALGQIVEVVDDPLGADDDGAVLEHQHRHGAHAASELEHAAVGGILGHLSCHEVDPELREPLPDALRAAAPLRLEELEHAPIAADGGSGVIGPGADPLCGDSPTGRRA